MTRNGVNVEDIIKEDFIAPESVFDLKRTKTTLFMLPAIFPNNSLVSSEYFVNAFIDDTKFKHLLSGVIFVLFKAEPKNYKWQTLAQKLRGRVEFVLEYFCGMQDGKHLVMMV